jgi:hypothetical protein
LRRLDDDLAVDAGDGDALLRRRFQLSVLCLQLDVAPGGNQLEGLLHLRLGAGHKQRDRFPDVVQPAPAGRLVAVALRDLVEIGAGSERGALAAGNGCAVRAEWRR